MSGSPVGHCWSPWCPFPPLCSAKRISPASRRRLIISGKALVCTPAPSGAAACICTGSPSRSAVHTEPLHARGCANVAGRVVTTPRRPPSRDLGRSHSICGSPAPSRPRPWARATCKLEPRGLCNRAQCRQLECDERYLRTQQMHVECRSFRFRFVRVQCPLDWILYL